MEQQAKEKYKRQVVAAGAISTALALAVMACLAAYGMGGLRRWLSFAAGVAAACLALYCLYRVITAAPDKTASITWYLLRLVVEFGAVLEQALDGACAVPLEIMEACCEGIALAQEYAAKGSALAVSDAGCAALFCKAALQASGLNVSINTKLMADRAHAEALNAKADALLAQYVPLADTVYEKLATQLRGEV